MNFKLESGAFPARLRRELQGWEAVQPLAADGSDRQFYRLSRPGSSRICLYHPRPPGDRVSENDSYYYIGRHLREQEAPVPEIFTYCREEGWFLLQDLGNTSLQEHYRRQTDPEAQQVLYLKALEVLIHLQVFGTPGFSAAWCFDTPEYDVDLVRHRECGYFLEAFLRGYLGLNLPPEALNEEFARLLQRALSPAQKSFLHRDFQSRNLMVHQDRLWLIDFQGARLGPQHYDLASLLLDPYVNLPPDRQEFLVTAYLDRLQQYVAIDPEAWRRQYTYVALCRNLQILGAYGFLSHQKGKKFFEQFIPVACRSLVSRLDLLPAGDFPNLKKLAAQADALMRGRLSENI
jgi:aminoglycoside/choline kinase family phosphotransferase